MTKTSNQPQNWLVTGNAGFIGFHIAKTLLEQGRNVVGFDVVNDYYDPEIKESRLKELDAIADNCGSSYHFYRENLADLAAVNKCFAEHKFDRVVHLAAQAGIRYSLENPHAYVESNLVAFTNMLEACRHSKTAHLIYASSSSVYGANTKMPFSEHQGVDHPLQFYAATKRANELMAHAYSNLYDLPTTGLRFFTVYGPWGRPDMALYLFTKNIIEGKPIKLFNNGQHTRDFTYIDDIVEGVIRISEGIAEPDPDWDGANPNPSTSYAPYRLYNIGNNNPTDMSQYVKAIEQAVGKKAICDLYPHQPGDVLDSYADVSKLIAAVDYKPGTAVNIGVAKFVEWYRNYYNC